tara:strand:+ start:8461 stop:9648 length:1188 start_codon:yes stop_codon:yes gene_type:complete
MGKFTIGSTIYTKLTSDATINGYVGTSPVRIYPDIAPLSAAQTFPYITYSIISQVPTNTKGPFDQGDPVGSGPSAQRSPLDVVRVQINSFTNDYATGVNLADRIRHVLDRGIGSGFTIGSGPDIDSIVYDGMSHTYEDKIKPQGVYNFQQEYVIRTINTDIAPTFINTFSTNFDGVDDFVTFGDSNVFSFGNGSTDSPFSISCWTRFNSVANSVGVMGKDSSSTAREYQIRMGFSNLRIRLYDDSTGGHITKNLSNPLSISTWYHLVFTYDGSSSVSGLKIYVDAVTPAQGDATAGTYTAMENTSSPFTIGEINTGFMNGNIDEVGMFNTELTASEILAIYNGGTPETLVGHAGLVGYWRMGDSGSFPVINDNSSNTNNGTCQNMVASDFQNLIP